MVVQVGALEGFGRNSNRKLFTGVLRLEFGLDAIFPLFFQDVFDTSLAELVPLPAQAVSTDGLEGLVDKDATTETPLAPVC